MVKIHSDIIHCSDVWMEVLVCSVFCLPGYFADDSFSDFCFYLYSEYYVNHTKSIPLCLSLFILFDHVINKTLESLLLISLP